MLLAPLTTAEVAITVRSDGPSMVRRLPVVESLVSSKVAGGRVWLSTVACVFGFISLVVFSI